MKPPSPFVVFKCPKCKWKMSSVRRDRPGDYYWCCFCGEETPAKKAKVADVQRG